jgi:hypothetical protein
VAREDDILQDISSGSGPPWEGARPLYVRTGSPGKVQNLHGRAQTPLCRVQATHSKVPGYRDKEYPGLDQSQEGVRSRHVSKPYCVRFRSSLRRRPDAAAWPTARDVSQRAEPDVRLLGRASSAFIADKTRRLTGDVPPRHLMSPVHFTNKRCVASAFIVPCPLRWPAATRPSCRRRACLFCWQAVRPCCGIRCAHHHSYVAREASAARQCYADRGYQGARRLHCQPALVAPSITPLCSWARMSGLSTLVRAPLSYKRGGTQPYKGDTLRLSDSQVHTSSQAQYIT